MNVHELDRFLVRTGLGFAGFEYRVRQEFVQRRHLRIVVAYQPEGGIDQFLQVFHSSFGGFAAVAPVMGEQPARLGDPAHLLMQHHVPGVGVQAVHQLQEALYRPACAGCQAPVPEAVRGSGPQARAGAGRAGADRLHGPGAHAPGRQVDHPVEGGIVVPVGNKTQVGQRILDLGALEEPQSAINPVGDLRGEQRLFENPGLRVGPVQHRRLVAPMSSHEVFADAVDHEVRFVVFVERGIERDGFPGLAFGPQILSHPHRVVGDDGVGGVEDVAGRPVVLFQAHQTGTGEVTLETLEMLHPRPAPAEDGLIVVTHHERRACRPGQEFHPPVLNRVGVLEFIHQNVLEPPLVLFPQFRPLLDQFQRAQQQFAEVHHRGCAAYLLVTCIEVDELPALCTALVVDAAGAQSLVLLAVDEPLYLPRRRLVLIEAETLQQTADDAQLILRIDDLKTFRQPGLAPVNSQQPVRQAVECADPEVAGRETQQILDPMAHFPGGLVGKGDREEMLGHDVLDADQPGDPVHEHAGLAASGAGEHQHRPPDGRGYRLSLRVIQRIDDCGDVHVESRRVGLVRPAGYSGQKTGM